MSKKQVPPVGPDLQRRTPEAALFVEGLGLDSIDALELSMVLEERYGVRIGDDPEMNQQIFASVRNLATFVDQNRAA